MIWLLAYLILTIAFIIDIVMSITTLEYVRLVISVKERPKLVEKINELKNLKKYCIVWPYVLYRMLKNG
jgi:hypothetical protein